MESDLRWLTVLIAAALLGCGEDSDTAAGGTTAVSAGGAGGSPSTAGA